MKYKAVITDLDGTAVDSPGHKVASHRMADATRRLEAAGVKVCAATGRPESYAMPILTSMQLTEPCIVAGGTRIINPVTRKELWRCGMNSQQMRQIVAVAEQFNYGYLWNDYVEAAYTNGGWDIQTFDAYEDSYFFEICYIPESDVSDVVAAFGHIEAIAVTVVLAQRPGMRDIHITNAQATKEHAVHELERIIGVREAVMIGVGDGHNDVHLYNSVGHKVAMANAVPELKALADEIIGDVTEDGLAIYFERLAETGGEL